MERVVRPDGSVLVDGVLFAPRDAHSRRLMQGRSGKRVSVREEDFYGTRMEASIRFPCGAPENAALLHMQQDDQGRPVRGEPVRRKRVAVGD